MSASEVAHYRSRQYDLWIGENNGYLILEGFVKTGDALKHLVWGVADSRLDTAVDLVLRYGKTVRRPYRLGGACDGSIDAPVMALFLDFCRRHGLAPTSFTPWPTRTTRRSHETRSPTSPTGRASSSPTPGAPHALRGCSRR